MKGPVPMPLADRFWAKVDKRGPDECWPWKAGKSMGYGTIGIPGNRKDRAHRVAYAIAHGRIPAGLYVRHKCDNPPCCNPSHLELGTHLDNIRDMKIRGRASRVPRAWGENNHKAKLKEWDVICIRYAVAIGATKYALARAYNLSKGAIDSAMFGWRHI